MAVSYQFSRSVQSGIPISFQECTEQYKYSINIREEYRAVYALFSEQCTEQYVFKIFKTCTEQYDYQLLQSAQGNIPQSPQEVYKVVYLSVIMSAHSSLPMSSGRIHGISYMSLHGECGAVYVYVFKKCTEQYTYVFKKNTENFPRVSMKIADEYTYIFKKCTEQHTHKCSRSVQSSIIIDLRELYRTICLSVFKKFTQQPSAISISKDVTKQCTPQPLTCTQCSLYLFPRSVRSNIVPVSHKYTKQ